LEESLKIIIGMLRASTLQPTGISKDVSP
jgi:hypothetical protein